jgi:hypothetical protein
VFLLPFTCHFSEQYTRLPLAIQVDWRDEFHSMARVVPHCVQGLSPSIADTVWVLTNTRLVFYDSAKCGEKCVTACQSSYGVTFSARRSCDYKLLGRPKLKSDIFLISLRSPKFVSTTYFVIPIVPRRRHRVLVRKTSRWMPFMEVIADTFKCFTRTYMNNQSDTAVNWLLEQFVTSQVLYEYRSNKS